MLSTLRGAVAPAEAHRRWTVDLRNASVGSYGVSVGEVDSVTFTRQSDQAVVRLQAVDDAVTQGRDHASIVFGELSKGQREQAARKLKDHALARGCLHP